MCPTDKKYFKPYYYGEDVGYNCMECDEEFQTFDEIIEHGDETGHAVIYEAEL